MRSSIIVTLILLAFLVAAMYIMPNIRSVALVNLVSLLLLTYKICRKQRRVFSPLLLILLSLYIFHSGHLWLSLFKANPLIYLMDFGYSSSEQELVFIYRLLTNMLILFGCVGLYFVKETFALRDNNYISLPSGINILVILLYLIMMYYEVQRAGNVSAQGYGGGYHYSNAFALMLADWINILLVMMMYVYRNDSNRFWRYTCMLLFRALFIMFFVGNRGSSVIQIITAVFIISRYSYISEDKVKLRRIIWGMGFFLLIALPLVSMLRSGVSSGDVFSNQGPIESFFIEFGDTARNMFLVDGYVSTFGPVNGLQMLSTSLTIFPMSTLFFGNLINKYGIVAAFLNDYYNMRGLGGSMFAQLYFNFGSSGWLFVSIAIMALFTTWVSNSLMTKNNSIYRTIIFLGLFVGLITNVRGEWYSTMSSLKISLYLCVILLLFTIKKS